MWEDMDSRKKSKGQKLFSQGVVVLVCLILAAQAVFFGKYLIDSRRSGSSDGSSGRTMQETERQTAQADGQGNAQDNAAGGRAGRHSYSDAGFKAGDNGTAPDRPNEPRQDGHPDRTSSAASAPRPGSTSRANPPDPAHPHSPASTAAGNQDTYPSGTPDGRNNSIQTDSPSAAYPHDGWHWDRVELNSADSAALDALPGIGPYYARQILAYRDRLGFYADLTQLLDIRGMDTARLHRLADRLYIDPASIRPLDLYTMSLDSMAAHPYIGTYAAKGIERLRRTLPRDQFTFQTILDSRILPPAQARRLALYFAPAADTGPTEPE